MSLAVGTRDRPIVSSASRVTSSPTVPAKSFARANWSRATGAKSRTAWHTMRVDAFSMFSMTSCRFAKLAGSMLMGVVRVRKQRADSRGTCRPREADVLGNLVDADVAPVLQKGGYGRGAAPDETVEYDIVRFGQKADQPSRQFDGELRLVGVVGPHGRDVPHSPRAPLRPLVFLKALAVHLGDARLPEEVEVLELIDGAVGVRVPARVLPRRVFHPNATVVQVQARVVGRALQEAAHQLHARLRGVFAAADVVVLGAAVDRLLAHPQRLRQPVAVVAGVPLQDA